MKSGEWSVIANQIQHYESRQKKDGEGEQEVEFAAFSFAFSLFSSWFLFFLFLSSFSYRLLSSSFVRSLSSPSISDLFGDVLFLFICENRFSLYILLVRVRMYAIVIANSKSNGNVNICPYLINHNNNKKLLWVAYYAKSSSIYIQRQLRRQRRRYTISW